VNKRTCGYCGSKGKWTSYTHRWKPRSAGSRLGWLGHGPKIWLCTKCSPNEGLSPGVDIYTIWERLAKVRLPRSAFVPLSIICKRCKRVRKYMRNRLCTSCRKPR
jgi:hypothetical protein